VDGESTFTFDAELWVAENGSWHFVSLPSDASAQILERVDPSRPGFGSLYVDANIGATSWQTSIFPDSTRGTFVLPVKASVRKAERLRPGEVAVVSITLR